MKHPKRAVSQIYKGRWKLVKEYQMDIFNYVAGIVPENKVCYDDSIVYEVIKYTDDVLRERFLVEHSKVEKASTECV